MKLRITSIPNLIEFLKKLKSVDKSVLLELTQTELFSKIHTPDKAIMKSVRIPVSSVFEGRIETGESDRIKIGMIDVSRFIDCFKNFKPSDIVHLEISSANVDGDHVAVSLKVYTDMMKINFNCADLALMSYVDDAILSMVHGTDGSSASFRLYRSDFETLSSLCGLENNSEELLEFKLAPTSVETAGQSFEYKLNIGSSDLDIPDATSIFIYKKQLGYIDLEQSQVFVQDNRMIFKSEERSSTIAIGLIQK